MSSMAFSFVEIGEICYITTRCIVSHMNSPTKFKVRGTPQLPKDKMLKRVLLPRTRYKFEPLCSRDYEVFWRCVKFSNLKLSMQDIIEEKYLYLICRQSIAQALVLDSPSLLRRALGSMHRNIQHAYIVSSWLFLHVDDPPDICLWMFFFR